MKVIFLDIDGVLNSGDNMRALHRLKVNHGIGETRDQHGQLFDDRCVNFLDCIIRETGAKLVISSTWRRAGLDKMKSMWNDRGLPGEVIDITPTTQDPEICERYFQPGADRGYEIQEWLENHPEVEQYVILDDDSDMLHHQPFVKCGGHYGITFSVMTDAISILNKSTENGNTAEDKA
jgi:hypothetical protein